MQQSSDDINGCCFSCIRSENDTVGRRCLSHVRAGHTEAGTLSSLADSRLSSLSLAHLSFSLSFFSSPPSTSVCPRLGCASGLPVCLPRFSCVSFAKPAKVRLYQFVKAPMLLLALCYCELSKPEALPMQSSLFLRLTGSSSSCKISYVPKPVRILLACVKGNSFFFFVSLSLSLLSLSPFLYLCVSPTPTDLSLSLLTLASISCLCRFDAGDRQLKYENTIIHRYIALSHHNTTNPN